MIAPDMATMLVFLFTDAKLAGRVFCRSCFRRARPRASTASRSMATPRHRTRCCSSLPARPGRFRPPSVGEDDPRLKGFAKALDALCLDLAHQVVKDGEGAEKLIEIAITGAETDKAARRIGMAIANSPLVKTAIAGEDANWGRIVMAIGKSGEKAERDRLKIKIGGVSGRQERHARSCLQAKPRSCRI